MSDEQNQKNDGGLKNFIRGKKIFRGVTNYYGHKRIKR